MQTATPKLYSFNYRQAKTYLIVFVFVCANLALPQLFHLMPDGGRIWLPIYFFTLVAAYKYGWQAGLLTAILSPVANTLLFGMPMASMLPGVLVKSVLLSFAASMAANRFKSVSLLILLGVVLSYQVAGSLVEWAISGSFFAATQDFRLAIPGMALQIAGGYLLLRYVLKK
jgi:hypothetical protein